MHFTLLVALANLRDDSCLNRSYTSYSRVEYILSQFRITQTGGFTLFLF